MPFFARPGTIATCLFGAVCAGIALLHTWRVPKRRASGASGRKGASAGGRPDEAWDRAFDALPDLVALIDREYRVTRVNRAMAERLGVSPAHCVGRTCHEIFHGSAEPPASCPHARACEDHQQHCADMVEPYLGGEFLESATPLLDADGRVLGAVLVARDITDRKRMEAQLQTALVTNQTLLREVHHRVKNNLQMLCDLLFLQMEGKPDQDRHPGLQDAYHRIYAMARLHEQLYQAMRAGQVDLGDYLRRLIENFEKVHPNASVCLDVQAPALALDLDGAMHVGLIVNELLTNALKHAFPQGREGMAGARLRAADDALELEVWDTGVGLPAGFDIAATQSLGLRIVQALSARLRATVTVHSKVGTRFTIRFPAGELA